jgi:hypothetical protein
MVTFECSSCGAQAVERSYDVMAVEVQCPREDCEEFCPHVNLDHPRVTRVVERLGLDRSARAVVGALRGL